MKFYKELEAEQKRLEKEIRIRKTYIAKAPKGKIECYRDGNTYKWRVITKSISENGEYKYTRKYLRKKELKTARALAVKGLYENELIDYEREFKAIGKILKLNSNSTRSEVFCNKNPEIRRLLEAHLNIWDEKQKSWLDNKYNGAVPCPEKRTRLTRAGFKVRSKSEQIIAAALFNHGIPTKYEERLDVSAAYRIIASSGIPFAGKRYNTYYPDFTMLHPSTGEEIIWEHFGMMSDPGYIAEATNKILVYSMLGYQANRNIIYTFEDNNSGVDELWVEKIIEHSLE